MHQPHDATRRAPMFEHTGAAPVPGADRKSRLSNVVAVFTGGNFWWGAVLYSWILAQLGLSFWQTISAALLGALAGACAAGPIAGVSLRTATNLPVASSAFFGARGRFIGTGISLVIALVYTALTVWTSGDAIVATTHRWLGTADGPAQYALGYAFVAGIILTVAVLGHHVIVRAQRFLAPVSAILLILGALAFFPMFDPTPVVTEYALGSAWPTWMLGFTIAFSGPISYGPMTGDYVRYLSPARYSEKQVGATLAASLFIAEFIPVVVGAVLAYSLHGAAGISFLPELIAAAPEWYILPILLVAISGGFGQGVMGLYATGLDLSAILPRLSRVTTTLLSGALAIALLFVGAFVFDLATSVEAVAVLLGAITAPWIVVMLVGHVSRGTIPYDTAGLHSALSGDRAGRYWYRAGWNLPAVACWALGAAFGVSAINTEIFTGPLAGAFGGVDLSILGAMLVSAIAATAARSRLLPATPGVSSEHRIAA